MHSRNNLYPPPSNNSTLVQAQAEKKRYLKANTKQGGRERERGGKKGNSVHYPRKYHLTRPKRGQMVPRSATWGFVKRARARTPLQMPSVRETKSKKTLEALSIRSGFAAAPALWPRLSRPGEKGSPMVTRVESERKGEPLSFSLRPRHRNAAPETRFNTFAFVRARSRSTFQIAYFHEKGARGRGGLMANTAF